MALKCVQKFGILSVWSHTALTRHPWLTENGTLNDDDHNVGSSFPCRSNVEWWKSAVKVGGPSADGRTDGWTNGRTLHADQREKKKTRFAVVDLKVFSPVC